MSQHHLLPGAGQGTVTAYTVGFLLSLILTVEAYVLVAYNVLNGPFLIAAIATTAVIQLIVQLVFFLHLGSESKPHWNLLAFLFMLMVLLTLVFGSLWIMNNLSYHEMSPKQTDSYLIQDEGIRE